MMLLISPILALVSLLVVPVSLFATIFIVRRSQKQFVAQWATTGSLNGHVEEMHSGHAIVKAFGRQHEAIERFEEENERLYDASRKAQFISGTIQPVMTFISNLNYVAIAVIGGLRVAAGQMSLGDVVAFIQYSRQFTFPIIQLASVVNVLQSAVASAERVFELLDEKEESADPSVAPAFREPVGAVAFEDVSFRYEPDKPLIEDLSLTVAAGRTVAIVGPTGAGKTTLVNLLMRFYELDNGRITIDGIDTRDLHRDALRRAFGMVLQDTWLFHGTIRENIAYGRLDATEEEIRAASEAAHVDHFVRTLTDGYDTVIDDDATNVSAGEKQLLTIARAFLADPPILILDEATSSVDTRTEVLIQRAMSRLMKGRTTFVIAHRLSTIRDADTILVMERGRIVEQGNHEQLLARGGAYADLYQSQFSGSPCRSRLTVAHPHAIAALPAALRAHAPSGALACGAPRRLALTHVCATNAVTGAGDERGTSGGTAHPIGGLIPPAGTGSLRPPPDAMRPAIRIVRRGAFAPAPQGDRLDLVLQPRRPASPPRRSRVARRALFALAASALVAALVAPAAVAASAASRAPQLKTVHPTSAAAKNRKTVPGVVLVTYRPGTSKVDRTSDPPLRPRDPGRGAVAAVRCRREGHAAVRRLGRHGDHRPRAAPGGPLGGAGLRPPDGRDLERPAPDRRRAGARSDVGPAVGEQQPGEHLRQRRDRRLGPGGDGQPQHRRRRRRRGHPGRPSGPRGQHLDEPLGPAQRARRRRQRLCRRRPRLGLQAQRQQRLRRARHRRPCDPRGGDDRRGRRKRDGRRRGELERDPDQRQVPRGNRRHRRRDPGDRLPDRSQGPPRPADRRVQQQLGRRRVQPGPDRRDQPGRRPGDPVRRRGRQRRRERRRRGRVLSGGRQVRQALPVRSAPWLGLHRVRRRDHQDRGARQLLELRRRSASISAPPAATSCRPILPRSTRGSTGPPWPRPTSRARSPCSLPAASA